MTKLLSAADPFPVESLNADGPSPLVLLCDHAGRRVPAPLGDLGLPGPEFDRHIAWDIGIAPVARILSDRLGASLIAQRYSRLVIDCNRPPRVRNSIPEISEATPIPGNKGLSAEEKAARRREIFDPYHAAITDALDARRHRPTILIALHSFTPVYLDDVRPWHVGTLYGRDDRVAKVLGLLLSAEDRFVVGDNKPYDVTDETDHTIPVHGEMRGIPHVGIEIRQDLLIDEAGQRDWAEILTRLLPQAAETILRTPCES